MNLPFTAFTGGCLCGEARYECSSRPLTKVKCHFRDCQRVSGGPYAPMASVDILLETIEAAVTGGPMYH
jgi:hypothetical protein